MGHKGCLHLCVDRLCFVAECKCGQKCILTLSLWKFFRQPGMHFRTIEKTIFYLLITSSKGQRRAIHTADSWTVPTARWTCVSITVTQTSILGGVQGLCACMEQGCDCDITMRLKPTASHRPTNTEGRTQQPITAQKHWAELMWLVMWSSPPQ